MHPSWMACTVGDPRRIGDKLGGRVLVHLDEVDDVTELDDGQTRVRYRDGHSRVLAEPVGDIEDFLNRFITDQIERPHG